jgi:ABC-type phosphonate transport system ATPase subunit
MMTEQEKNLARWLWRLNGDPIQKRLARINDAILQGHIRDSAVEWLQQAIRAAYRVDSGPGFAARGMNDHTWRSGAK